MGVSGLLPRLLPACGRRLDLSHLRGGVPIQAAAPPAADEGDGVPANGRHGGVEAAGTKRRLTADDDEGAPDADARRGIGKRRRTTRSSSGKSRTRRRPVRIALDASGWVARACHGHGASLLDERRMTRYGRAELAERGTAAATAASSRGVADGNGPGNGGACSGAVVAPGAPAGGGDDDHHDDDDDGRRRDRLAAARVRSSLDAASERAYRDSLRADFVAGCAASVVKRILALARSAGAEVLVVLDGATPPAKIAMCRRRRERREGHAARAEAGEGGEGRGGTGTAEGAAADADAEGDVERRISAAKRAGAQTSELHSKVVRELIASLRAVHVPFLVAPYEADAQLAYLARRGLVDLVVTDDSDLVGHGVPAALYKLGDREGGGTTEGGTSAVRSAAASAGILVRRSDLGCVPSPLSLLDFSDVMLAATFVAAGCDYCDSLRGVGIVRARDAVKEAFHGMEAHENVRMKGEDASAGGGGDGGRPTMLGKIFKRLFSECYGQKLSDADKEEYERTFLGALLMYRHPVVFDPLRGRCVLWRDPTRRGADPELADHGPYADLCADGAKVEAVVGKVYGAATATAIAEGWMDPKAVGRLYSEADTPAGVMAALRRGENGGNHGRLPTAQTNSGGPAVRLGSPSRPSQQTQSSQATGGTDSTTLSHPSTQPSSQPSHRSELSADVLSPDLLLPSPLSQRMTPSPARGAGAGAAGRGMGIMGVVERLSSRSGAGGASPEECRTTA